MAASKKKKTGKKPGKKSGGKKQAPRRTGPDRAGSGASHAPRHQRGRGKEPAVRIEKPEILAPAGGLPSWAAAVEAGADAVYMGLKGFSARAFAANFSLAELAEVTALSHEKGTKIFLAFNALAKEEELPEAARLLESLAEIGPDALILQDMGLFHLIRKEFPQFEVHASTLTAVHNLPGLKVLAGMGFDRAVLARELTIGEAGRLAERSPIPVEIFIHGALCYSFSGLCLMSGFLGGKGSLRGACTQPCRRRYSAGKKRGYFFSPTDLEAVDVMRRIRSLPFSALKIEGRMKGPEYVTRVVQAYRLMLDAPDADLEKAAEEAVELLDASLGRQRSSGFLMTPGGEGALAPHSAATSGLYVGRIADGNESGGRLELKEALKVGDRVRVQFKKDDERRAFTIKQMDLEGESVELAESDSEIFLHAPEALSPGDLVFKVDTAKGEKDALQTDLVRAVRNGSRKRDENAPDSQRLKQILADLKASPDYKGGSKKFETWYRIARAEDVAGLRDVRPDRIILPLTTANVRRMASMKRRLGDLFNKTIWAPEPLVFERGLSQLQRDVKQLAMMGIRNFLISNLGHLPLVSGEVKGRRGKAIVYADYRLSCLNTKAEAELAELGISGLTLCLESDEPNLKEMLSKPGPVDRLLYLFGRPALFTSRFQQSGMKDNHTVQSPRQERFRIRQKGDFHQVFAEQPVFLAPLLKQKWFKGVAACIVDLEFDPRPLATAKQVYEAIQRGRPIRSASRFNLARGLF